MAVIEPERWRQKPVEVEAVYLTVENARDVAEWCGGAVVMWSGGVVTREPFALTMLAVDGGHTLRIVPEDGESGWWIVRSPLGGFEAFRDRAWRATHDSVLPERPAGWRGSARSRA